MGRAVSEPLVAASGLTRHFAAGGLFRRGQPVQAVSDVSLTLRRSEAVGLVGESGSGKSTIGRLLLGLLQPTSGRVSFAGADLAKASRAKLRALRPRMQLVFQDPYSSLDPRRRVGGQIADGPAIHRLWPRRERNSHVAALLQQVGLAPPHAMRFPGQFSGGQRQRLAIARALATAPDFLVADEPVSALDLSVQAQVLNLLAELRAELGLTLLFISHDLAAVRSLCDRVVVLYLGRVMEQGTTRAVFSAPQHPYTRALLSAMPSLDPARRRTRILLAGEPPSAADPPSGCVFRTRCPHALPACANAVPRLREAGEPSHFKACIRDDIEV
jgi:oligopeptide/dipeptide ABC transporter ATP-binding protein